ncbi:MAG: hypothetical protein U9Q29_09750 [Campylobacterota bacterium]|nr:hypothetical protein [Campylobacterota bacterium]
MEFFLKHKTVIFRSLGAVLLVIGFGVHFWVTPKEGLSANQKAAANVARMEAKVRGETSSSLKSQKKDGSKFLDELKNTQKKQMQYLTIIAMIVGIGFLGYSFMPKKD